MYILCREAQADKNLGEMESPEDNTMVVRMMGDFDRFIAKDIGE